MYRRMIFVLLFTSMFTYGCATRTLGPKPEEPQVYMNIRIDSIPSGADVYTIDTDDGTLVTKLCTTPCDLPVGLATKYWSTGERALTCGGCVTMWGRYVKFGEYNEDTKGWDILLSLAIVKDGYRTKALIEKPVGIIGGDHDFPPPDRHITLRLEETDGSYYGSDNYEIEYCLRKKREYEAALRAYKKALSKLSSAKTWSSFYDLGWAQKKYSEPGFDKGMVFLGMLGSKMNRYDAEKEVEAARQRLEAAKAQLCD